MFDYLIDLFSGAGGFTLGLQQAGLKFKQVFYSDINKYANAVYKYNFPNHKELEDVKTIRTESLPRGRGIVTFGFPCQDLSIAGKRKGLDGSRSGLFYEATRIIRDLQPEVFIFENVKGLFSADEGQAFIRVLREIADIGIYECEWQLVNTRWVLPQNRERIYFIGHLRGRSEPKVFPIRESIENANKARKPETNEIAQCIRASGNDKLKGSHVKLTQMGNTGKNSQGYRVYSTDGISTTLAGQAGGVGAKTGLYAIKTNTKKGFEIAEDGDSINLAVPDSKTRRGRVGKKVAQTLDTACNQGTMHSTYRHAFEGFKGYDNISVPIKSSEGSGNQIILNGIRRLTPTECERLQGFPDSWSAKGNFNGEVKDISDTQRYKLMGNAVTVDIVKIIGEKLI